MALTADDERDAYCRDVESYLCRKNDGHLIRIVGPAFEQVCGWAARGIPLKIVCRGIDRYFDRYYARGPRRRPVRIEFCEADVLDVFDEWRRAVGITPVDETEGDSHPRASLPAHLERLVARLTTLRAGGGRAALDPTLDAIVRELDAARAGSRNVRGERREALLQRLEALDRRLLDAAREASEPALVERLRAEADEELAPFRQRMTADVYRQSREACVDRLLREHFSLPTIAFE
jgi:hypothetical protein